MSKCKNIYCYGYTEAEDDGCGVGISEHCRSKKTFQDHTGNYPNEENIMCENCHYFETNVCEDCSHFYDDKYKVVK